MINAILTEGMPAYFLGQKKLGIVVAIIQDRVKKYRMMNGVNFYFIVRLKIMSITNSEKNVKETILKTLGFLSWNFSKSGSKASIRSRANSPHVMTDLAQMYPFILPKLSMTIE